VLSLASGTDAAGSRLSKLNLTQTVLIGKALDIALTTLNISSESQSYSEGLHTYFHVDDVAEIVVGGLDGREYVDLTDSNRRRHQSGGVTFSEEVGRVFVASQDSCTIEDRRLGRRIRVDKWGSNSTAIWNPWADVATRMTDLGSDGWRSMVCVETANALDDSVMLDAGQQATMTARYSVEALR
jgi:D-hexose-6-phosphate mutarotase